MDASKTQKTSSFQNAISVVEALSTEEQSTEKRSLRLSKS